jgi:hypothetical protein
MPNVLHLAAGPADSAEIARNYNLDTPLRMSRTIGGNVVLVFGPRNHGLDTDELFVTLDPCTLRLRDADLGGNTAFSRAPQGRQ